MLLPDHKSTRTRRRLGRGIAVTSLSLATGLAVVSPAAASTTRTTTELPASEAAAAAAATPFNTAIAKARADLSAAVVYLTNHQYVLATTALRTFRTSLATVHQLGMTNMGPVKAVATLRLEHRVAMQLLPPFNGLTNAPALTALQTTLTTTFTYRTAMLNKIIAQPEEGPIDWGDAMADTVPIYLAELTAYASALNKFQLTDPARTALTADLAKVRATRQQVIARVGGGE
jgi:hypothetical protein